MLKASFVIKNGHPPKKPRNERPLKTPTSLRCEICRDGNTDMGREEAFYAAVQMSSSLDFGCEKGFRVVVGYRSSKCSWCWKGKEVGHSVTWCSCRREGSVWGWSCFTLILIWQLGWPSFEGLWCEGSRGVVVLLTSIGTTEANDTSYLLCECGNGVLYLIKTIIHFSKSSSCCSCYWFSIRISMSALVWSQEIVFTDLSHRFGFLYTHSTSNSTHFEHAGFLASHLLRLVRHISHCYPIS